MMLKKALMMIMIDVWIMFYRIFQWHRVFKVKLSSQCSDVTYHQRNRIPHQVNNLVRSVSSYDTTF